MNAVRHEPRRPVREMLEIDLHSLDSEPRDWRAQVPVGEGPWSDTELGFAGPVVVELRAGLTGDRGVHVQGELRARLVLTCRRCLSDFRRDLTVSLDLLYDPGVDKEGEREQVYALEEEEAHLDLGPALREQLLLAVPPYPLCREDCRGLCPECGVDRNEESCDCTLREPDPRWQALRDLKERTADE